MGRVSSTWSRCKGGEEKKMEKVEGWVRSRRLSMNKGGKE